MGSSRRDKNNLKFHMIGKFYLYRMNLGGYSVDGKTSLSIWDQVKKERNQNR